MRKREDIETRFYETIVKLEGGTTRRLNIPQELEVLLDIRDLLSERHTRREKGKEVCGECGGAKKVIGSYQEDEQTGKIFPVYKPCPSCQPANTN